MKVFYTLFFFFSSIFFNTLFSQKLAPGFDPNEFLELLKIGSRTTTDSTWFGNVESPESELIYQSQPAGFDNIWQLWMRKDGVPIISIRGTTKTDVSFLANIYAAMVSAQGELHLSKDFTFQYNLSDDPKAAVHIGFLISTAYLSGDIISKIDSLYQKGTKEFIIAGHSQGGAISYLLTSYLENLKKNGQLPKDLRFKSCISAAPKPGNLYYAYDFENLTHGGWAYNVVNSVDWVPEVPFSTQTIHDLSPINPFQNAGNLIKKQKFPKNIVVKHIYKRLTKPSLKAQKNYQKYLGKMVSKFVKKTFPEFEVPVYFKSSDYVRT
ncbi:MAG: lipase family protein [Ginsengibacter sp.]